MRQNPSFTLASEEGVKRLIREHPWAMIVSMTDAAGLVDGLLRAAAGFGYRMPELHSGDPVTEVAVPVPYPAACRPQAWSAAASVAVLTAVLGLEPDGGEVRTNPIPSFGAVAVDGIRLGGREVRVG